MRKEKEKILNQSYQEFIEIGLNIRPIIDELKHLIDPKIIGFGTTEDERIFSRQDFIELIKRQEEQAVGIKLEHQVKPVHRRVLNGENAAIYVDDLMLRVTTDSDQFELKMRFSMVFECQEEKWVVVHWHGSKPEEVKSEEDTWGIDSWKKKTEELEQIVSEKTADLLEKNRELAIEAALEKVRAVAMGMKKPEDMLDVCRIISDQLQQFGVEKIRNVQTAIIDENIGQYLCYQYFTPYTKTAIEITEYLKSPVEHGMVKQMLASRDGYFIGSLSGKDLEDFRLHRKEENHFQDPHLDEAMEVDYCFLSIGEGGLGLTLYQPMTEETLSLFKRFHQVFSLAYQRFRDIQKALAQAREAQIEAALERVRAQTMAMHSSEDVGKCVVKMFSELTALGVDQGTRFGIGILNHENENNQLWTARKTGEEVNMHIGNIDMAWHSMLKKARQAWIEQVPFHKYILEGEDLLNYYQMLNNAPDYKIQIPLEELPKKEIQHCFIFEHGFFYAFSPREFQPELIHITKRFSTLFEQTYRRYLDLVKAETQAREAEIELALERIRARTMAMQESDELAEVSSLLFRQMEVLGVGTYSSGFTIWDEDQDELISWMCNADGSMNPPFRMPIEEDKWHKEQYDSWKKGDDFITKNLKGEEMQSYFLYLRSFPLLDEAFEKSIAAGHPMPEKQVHHVANFSHGNLLFITLKPYPKAHELFKRLAKVFEQTYTRFLDLQKAEAQAREAQIETGLERVRSKSLAMHKTAELQSVIHTVHQELINLNISISGGSFIVINSEIDNEIQCWGSGGTADTSDRVHIPHFEKPIYTQLLNRLKSGPGFFTEEYTQEEKIEFFTFLFQHEPWSKLSTKEKKHTLSASGGYTRSCAVLHHTSILIINHWGEKFSEAENAILKRFGKVFEQSYTRFLDLQKAEAQAREAEIQLALERVRAKTMAMKTQSDLFDIIELFGKQLNAVGIRFDNVTFIEGPITEKRDWDLWSYAPEAENTTDKILIPYIETPYFTKTAKAVKEYQKTGHPIQVKTFTQKEKSEFLDHYWRHAPAVSDEFVNYVNATPGSIIVDAFLAEITVSMVKWNAEPYTDEELKIYERFAKEFRQTYIRFLDIKKAEAQAREAQIEAALEKVRSRSLAMHSSDELNEVVKVLFEKMTELQVPSTAIGIQTFPEGSKDMQCFVCGDVGNGMVINQYLLPYFDHPILKDYIESHRKGLDHFVGTYSKELKDSLYEVVLELPELKDIPVEVKTMILESKFYEITMVSSKKSTLAVNDFIGNPLSESQIAILKRFAKVFDQSYLRFLDLQKAEAQAREAQIEAALERVRSRTMAMQSSEELSEAATEMFGQIKGLGLNPWSCGFNIFNDDKTVISQWVSSGDGRPIKPFDTPTTKDVFKQIVEHSEHDELLYIQKMEGKKLENTYKYMASLPTLDKIFEELDAAGIALPKSQVDHVAYFKHGYLMFITYEETPEFHSIFKRFAKVFEQTYTRFLDLKKAEAQAREAKIEAALEKVRSRSMGMQSSEELPEVANLMFLEIQALGIHAWSCGYCILEEDRRSSTCIMSSEGTIQKPFLLPHFGEPSFEEWDDFVQSNESFFVQELKGKAIKSHYDFMTSLPQLKATFQELKDAGLSLPTYQINHLCKFTHGFLLFITYEPVSESHEIFKRFTNVFDQTYTRFLDLQKAEAQAQEARIEAALERVRSRTMGMQKAEELGEVAIVLFSELNSLVDNLWTCGFVLCEKDRKEDEWWLSLNNGLIEPFSLPNVGDYAHESLYEGWEKGDSYRTVTLEDKQLQQHYNWLMKIPIAEKIFEEMESSGIPRPNWQRLHAAYFKTGYLVIITEVPCEEEEIFKRFAQVFDLTYTRFLDLKKAEAQAREAQIEAALEKVRSRSLAMQSPDELIEVAQLLREEMGALGVEELETSSIYIQDESTGLTQCWFTIKNPDTPDKGITDQMVIDLQDTWVGRKMDEFYRSKAKQTSILMQGKERIEWIRYCEEKSDLFGTSNFYGETIPDRTYHLYKFSNGYIGAAAPGEISPESWELLKRATAVFSFAYTRFRDLQMAQASARTAMRQASLDRVRADISSMRHADDLDRITPLFFKELTELGVPFIRCGVFIINEKQKLVEAYLSSPEGNSLGVLRLPYQASELTHQTVKAWRKGEIYTQHWNKEDFIQWINQLMEQDQIQDGNTYQGTAAPPESLDLHFVPFPQGMLYVGAVNPLTENELELVQALAKAFSVAYARYEDFVKLEQAKAEIESAMIELKATQTQLVQQEKLASLGQLTAGIAHEIKNPLNFVNNFSELSSELIDEAFEELEKLESSEEKEEIIAILQDVKGNLTKVHEHGTRANGIVTSMLQHSRGGDGKMEPTDLNALLKEYINLSFHGMRAAKNPINVDIALKFDEKIGKVNLVSEDFSRVIVNLCNNAFDAMRLKTNDESSNYQPKLTVCTKAEKNQVTIEVEDNGPGIPDSIKDKILQPFFTTKKGTEGTGLGLSITHDIVKAHGGQLQVESSPGEGSTFIIQLPKGDL
ncbi:ATP-binding protein [Algoriphagus faecimaris]|uniref:ATP-binding protein n=1 Tax=Algoriphagus faecimaris TaxID=686796 RepID=UPI000B4449A5|nr:ATP-binding protein [Algoriphagus faecimaris]